MEPKVSVVIPIFNAEKYLRQCLDSVVNQTLKDIEIICVNDGSTDSSLEIIKEYALKDNRIVVIDKPNGGYGAAVNVGFNRARAAWVGIVEPDDYIDLEMYKILYDGVLSNKEIEIVKAGYYDYFDFDTHDYTKIQLGLKVSNNNVFTISEKPELLRIHPSVWSCIYKKVFLEKEKIKMIEAKGAGWVDNPFFLETLCQANKIMWINEPLYYYRQTNINSSSNLRDCDIPLDRLNDMFDILDERKIFNEDIISEIYKRAILYINIIEKNSNFQIAHIRRIKLLLGRMKREIVNKLSSNEKLVYARYKSMSLSKLNIKSSLLYKVLRKIYRAGKYAKEHGLIATYRRIRQEFVLTEAFSLPPKKNLRVMFIASDNSRTSGAFLSMVVLNRILRDKYNVETFVVLPNVGNGDLLLKEYKIPHVLVQSRDWVIPLNRKKDSELISDINKKREFNHKAISIIKKIAIDNKVDIIHINTTYSYVGANAALEAKIPFVWHLREFLEEDQGNTIWDREKANALINKANRIVAISRSIRKKYEKVFEDKKLVCIFNGIDTDKFYNPEKIILGNKIVRFIMIGGFEYYKGQIEFAKACAKLYDSGFHDLEIWFVGTGKSEVREIVQNIFNESNMSDKVTYWGYQKNVNEFLEKADVSFTCARSEAFGRTTVEAMLAGNLVIGANSAGTSELIKDNETGLLFEFQSTDSPDLYEKMLFVVNNRKQAQEIASKGREYMYVNMSADRNAENIYKLYLDILQK